MNATFAEKTEAPGADMEVITWERLLAPLSAAEFLKEYWEKAHLRIRRNEPDYYRQLFTLADVDRCLEMAKGSSDQVLTIVPPPGKGGKREVRADGISKDELYKAFSVGGATLRLLEVERFSPQVAVLAAELFELLQARVSVNLYLTPPESQAFATHFDYHDVFILQLTGAKNWSIYEPEFPFPTDSLEQVSGTAIPAPQVIAEGKGRLREHVRLEAGDLLYFPRGFYHKVTTAAETSLHLTIGVYPVYWIDFLKRALELVALEENGLRRALPPGYLDAEQVRARMAESFRSLMARAAETASFEKTLDSLTGSQLSSRPYPPDGHFRSLLRSEQVGLDTVVRRRAGLLCRVRQTEDGARILFGPNRVEGPTAVLSAFEFIRGHRQFQVRDLPGPLSEKSRVVLVRRLIREGLLRPID